MSEEKKPYLIINEEYDEIKINIKHTKPYMKLQQENQQLQGKYNIRSKAYNEVLLENASLKEENSQLKLDYELYKDNFVYRNYEVEIRDNAIKQLKEVIEEVREYIKHEWFKRGQLGIIDKSFQEWELNKLLQILDKAKENKDD